jgi:uncharacterized RDD family membrane protein YckC/cytoskeletal protein CcmA (bactofilin family)
MKPFRILFSLLGAFAGLSLTWVFAEDTPPPPPSEPVAPSAEMAPAVEAPAKTPAPASIEADKPQVKRAHAPTIAPPETIRERDWRRGQRDRVIFKWGHEAALEAGDEAEHVVSLFGSVRADGKVHGNGVAIFGPLFLGSTGSARGNVVAVLGNVRVDGPVDGNVVSVLGGVELGPKARVEGNVVSIGARIHADPEAVMEEGVVEIGAFGGLPELKGLQAWVQHALLLGRPLALHRDVLWAWGVAGLFLMLYLFIALVMNGALVKCSETLEQRPGKTVLASFLTVLLTPLLFIVLSVTVVGAPLLMLAMGVASLIGKAAFLCWFGRRVTLALGVRHAAPAVLVGAVFLTALYLVPFLGFAIMKLTDALGLGMVVYTLMLAGRKEKPVTATGSNAAGMGTGGCAGVGGGDAWKVPPPPASGGQEPVAAPATFASLPIMSQQQTQASGALPSPAPTISITAALPRAGFGIRLGALLLDGMLVFVASLMFGRMVGQGPSVAIMGMALYLVVLWALKGTTIGGIICGLKIVRLDDRPLDWTTAVVRGLAGFLSVIPAGLGFLWIVFDEEKQSWHDKVAGTVVVHAPKGMSLV